MTFTAYNIFRIHVNHERLSLEKIKAPIYDTISVTLLIMVCSRHGPSVHTDQCLYVYFIFFFNFSVATHLSYLLISGSWVSFA